MWALICWFSVSWATGSSKRWRSISIPASVRPLGLLAVTAVHVGNAIAEQQFSR